jgi:hypothetical protein
MRIGMGSLRRTGGQYQETSSGVNDSNEELETEELETEVDRDIFGRWFTDEFGLPAYEYTCNHELEPNARYFTTSGFSTDHWHQLGNDRLNVLAHNDGSVEVLESSRGLQWLCYRDKRRSQVGGGIAVVEDASGNDLAWSDLFSQRNYEGGYRRTFGLGYYRKTTHRNGITLDHFIFPPFADDCLVFSELNIVNDSDYLKELALYNYWGVGIKSIIPSMIYFDRQRKKFSKSALFNIIGKSYKFMSPALRYGPEHVRDSFSSKFNFQARYSPFLRTIILRPVFKGRGKPSRDEPSLKNYYPKSLFLTSMDAIPTRVAASSKALLNDKAKLEPHEEPFRNKLTAKDKPCMCLGVDVPLKPKERKKFTFLLGYADELQIPIIIDAYRSQMPSTIPTVLPYGEATFPSVKANSDMWKKNVIEFSTSDKEYDWIGREAMWHSYYMRSATLYDEYFENHLLPQGGAYNYLMGLQGAPRDFMLFSIPMIYTEPNLAREMLEYTMRLMAPDGRIPYVTNGFGSMSGNSFHKNPSDLQLFFLWGLSEYLFATRDYDFLNKNIPFYPKSRRITSTVYERLKLAVDFLLEAIGLGEHGLIRVCDGDWNDEISTMVRNRRRFLKFGESLFNSAFALYVLPRISLICERQQDKVYSSFIEDALKILHEGCLRSWNGKWFYRGWDGSGSPIGDANIFLEPLIWLLISGALPEDYAKQLIDSIYERLDKPSPFGQNLVSPPMSTTFNYLEKGWEVNGGIWSAINFLLSWGYGRYDKQKALDALTKNSMHHHEEVYPKVWYGIWSGPDAFNASYAPRPGETYYHLATPTTDFPIMNLNLHANFLTALLKLSGIEPTIDGLTISPNLPLKNFSLKTPIIQLEVGENELRGSYIQQSFEEFMLRFKLPQDWIGRDVRCFINDSVAPLKMREDLALGEVQLQPRGNRFKFRILPVS